MIISKGNYYKIKGENQNFIYQAMGNQPFLIIDLLEKDISKMFFGKTLNTKEFDFIAATEKEIKLCKAAELIYSFQEIDIFPEGEVVQSSVQKHSNQMTKRLEEIVLEEKKRHEQLLSTKMGTMKFEYRSECLAFKNQINSLENHKDFLLNQELFDPEKVLEAYVELFREWVRFD